MAFSERTLGARGVDAQVASQAGQQRDNIGTLTRSAQPVARELTPDQKVYAAGNRQRQADQVRILEQAIASQRNAAGK